MADPHPDARTQWVEDVVVPGLKIKVERFRKLLNSEADAAVVRDFLDATEAHAIYFADGAKELAVYAQAPANLKKKMLYLAKGEGGPLTADSVRSAVMYGDLHPKPLDGMLQVCADVYLPLISSPANQQGWPDVVANEVTELFHRTVSAMYIAMGQAQGKTMLPLPPAQMLVDGGTGSKDKIHVLETAVVTWTTQIKNVLKLDPEHVLQSGHPGPLAGLEFWETKATNLESMMAQLHGDKIRKVMRVLNITKSPYYDAFALLIKEVDLACAEAVDNKKFLRTLKPSFEKLNSSDDFLELPELFAPIMHIMLLVWRDSKHFNTPAGLAVLLREVCNDLIARARAYVEPEEVFNIEASEAVERLVMTLKVCGHFKSCYFTYKLKSAKEIPQNPWKVQNAALFPRLDAFLERCMDLLDLFKTVTQFEKLERVEIGGNKGAHLTMCVAQIYQDFEQLFTGFKEVGYDVLDIDITRFEPDYFAFRNRIQELEARLTNVLDDGFNDCGSIFDAFKLTDSFGDLLERDFIQADLELRHIALIKAYGADLQEVRTLFLSERYRSNEGKFYERDGAPLYVNMPPVAGSLFWVRGLIDRIEEPMSHLTKVMQVCADFDETRDVVALHEDVLSQLKEFEASMYEDWAVSVDEVSHDKLKMPLLQRDRDTAELAVNFDPALVRLLREVKYLHMLGRKAPAIAETLFEKHEVFRVQIGKLNHVTHMYNHMVRTMFEVEKPLLKAQMKQIDRLVEKGLRELSWSASGINDFIDQAMALVTEAHSTLGEMKANMAGVEKLLDEWAAQPLMRRKEGKTYSPVAFVEEHEQYLEGRYKNITESAKQIHKLLANSNVVLKVSKGAPAWRAYVEFINDIVLAGLSRTVVNSLQYLLKQIDPAVAKARDGPNADLTPMLEVELLLVGSEVKFSPMLGISGTREGLLDRVHALIADFYECVRLVARLERQDGDFLKEIEENEDVRFAVHRIITECEANEEECNAFCKPFYEHKHLWAKEIDTQLAKFVAECRLAPDGGAPGGQVAVRGGAAAAGDDDGASVAPSGPADVLSELDLAKFDQRIALYKAEQAEVEQLPTGATSRFVRINSKPIKHAIAVWASKWVYAYTHFLESRITASLDDLMAFVHKVQQGLNTEFDPEDTEQLITAMTYIRDVRRRAEGIDHMWEPLKGKVTLLKKYGIVVPEATMELIESAPQKWENAKKATVNAREALGPLQALQAEKIKEEVEDFGERVEAFVQAFHEEAPFKFDTNTERTYRLLDEWHVKLREMEDEAALMAESEELFEVHVHTFKEMHDCRTELGLLKRAWDMASLVLEIFNDWRNSLWSSVDVDEMIEETKRLLREVKSLPKAIKQWPVFIGLQAAVQDMMVSLPLIQDLRDESMRDRHWKKLMRICGKTFVMDTKFKLDHLLALNLHEFQDSVGDIVEQARQELKIDNQLQKIISTWAGLELQYEPFKQTGVYVLKPADTVIEALDDNENSLQNMMGNRFMSFFEVEINEWRTKLSKVRAVLDIWAEVQRAWCSLESIFLGSEDIREQLPEDAKRFDTIDGDFREQMGSAKETKNPIEACTAEGREEAFIKCQNNLDLCQKSLAEYLEVKKKRFPRFYFVSPADLVDILSKGRNPPLIQEHFSKFTDNIAKIEWEVDEETQAQTSLAKGMFSGEGEHIVYSEPYRCEGQVEEWLTGLMRHSQLEIKQMLQEAVNSFVELQRQEWLFKFCAQLSLTTSQIWWTEEVNMAFERLETGNDNALKDYLQNNIVSGLNTLTQLVATNLSSGDRIKFITLITIEVHARDIVQRLISTRVDNAQAFAWQSQLKYRWDEDRRDCIINICDAELTYSYEYTGNTGRLVITALTDRCYVTLTQALRLILGGAPAGPAGTGKTETTKDLGRGLAIWVIVQNCSDQMNNKVMANFFSGLAQTGAWGCFDEFNRLLAEVLSVCSIQYKSVLDAVRARAPTYTMDGVQYDLSPYGSMAFVTMNPGYLGRTELPESLKVLFRPVTVMVPDLQMIIENFLMAEGYTDALTLAKKFYTLYRLLADLLSKQLHYDWGLRAIKSVLVVAGSFKRAEQSQTETGLLMRALRDFNLPKMVDDDVVVFLGLLKDLFREVYDSMPRKRDDAFEDLVRGVAAEANLQPTDYFVQNVVDLQDVLDTRHCVFCLGSSGCNKTEAWRTLARAWTQGGVRGTTTLRDINPKAVTPNELYGYVNMATREWKDGLLSSTMREMANQPDTNPKWIILDGDLDANWIENMNSVMDDNRLLTLASNERIRLMPHMRLIFEIRDLQFATPATVTRAGILHLSELEQWANFVASWVAGRKREEAAGGKVPAAAADARAEKLVWLFDKYCRPTIAELHKHYKPLVPVLDFALVQSLCHMLEGLLTVENVGSTEDTSRFEVYFVFAAFWAFGGTLASSGGLDLRKLFSRWWKEQWKDVPFPNRGEIFDYFIDPDRHEFRLWSEIVPTTHFDSATMSASFVTVPTSETVSISFWLGQLIERARPAMLVGTAGCGKTAIINGKLRGLGPAYVTTTINVNYFTNAALFQRMLEDPLEKKVGRNYGPPGDKKLIYFVDDLNMAALDKYNTASNISIMRQHLGYGHVYDTAKLQEKQLVNTQYLAAMNPTAGSFVVNPRLQRLFATFAVGFPSAESLTTIYSTFMLAHVGALVPHMTETAKKIVQAALQLHKRVGATFRKTASKFHYEFNMRHMAGVFQGMHMARGEELSDPLAMVQLWLHESERVYGDRLVDAKDLKRYKDIALEQQRKHFKEFSPTLAFAEPLIFCHFARGAGESKYSKVESFAALSKQLEGSLVEYNELNPMMNLVLFDDAMRHTCRISRIIESPGGHALLIGVGGSGKQSLARLAAFVSGFAVVQLVISANYGMSELKHDLQRMFRKCGVKSEGTVFLFTDQQIADERFLVYINDLLSSGQIPGLFPPEDVDDIINSMRPFVKRAGLQDTRENAWNLFISQVKENLHVVLCFSPIGDPIKVRTRRFPALVNCVTIDWFQPWPEEALLSVSKRFLSSLDLGTEEEKANVINFMPYSFIAVNQASALFMERERRYNWTTPKSFLELIALYKSMLGKRRKETTAGIVRLSNGVTKLESTAEEVSELEEQLKVKQVEVEEKKAKCDEMIPRLEAEKTKASDEMKRASEIALQASEKEVAVGEMKEKIDRDLENAEPALVKAAAALDSLNKKDLGELKSLAKPPAGIDDVTGACVYLLHDGSKGKIDASWKASQQLMKDVNKFLDELLTFKDKIDNGQVPKQNFKNIRPLLDKEWFNVDTMRTKSAAAAGLCDWVLNITVYWDINENVEPMREAAANAVQQLEEAIRAKGAALQAAENAKEQVRELTQAFDEAVAEKDAVMAEAEACERKLGFAQRLMAALGSEGERWKQGIDSMKAELGILAGNALLASAFVSYSGCFNRHFREALLNDKFKPFLQGTIKEAKGVPIPMSAAADPLKILTNDAEIAQWSSDGLPTDRVSVENGTIVTNCARWPLMIDPQLQGVTWIKRKEEKRGLHVVRLGQRQLLPKLEDALINGKPIVIENIQVTIDAVLAPVIGRQVTRRGRTVFVKLGDKEVDYHPDFKLYLQTKLSNPHYPPEIQAETTLINFMVTEDGLEDQLLALTVSKERPDLEESKKELIAQMNGFKIKTKELEDGILEQLANAEGDVLENVALIENLEDSKRVAMEIAEKVKVAEVTELEINAARELYRRAANRGSLMFFLLSGLNRVHSFHHYSLNAFVSVFERAITGRRGKLVWNEEALMSGIAPEKLKRALKAEAAEHKKEELREHPERFEERLSYLVEAITYETFSYARRGLFERHKLILATQLLLAIMRREGELAPAEADYLVMGKKLLSPPHMTARVQEYLTEVQWAAACALKEVEAFKTLPEDLELATDAWREWLDTERPEESPLPGEWEKRCSAFQKILLLRALRSDRVTTAVAVFIEERLGVRYMQQEAFSMEDAYNDSSRALPLFFVLFPGVDPGQALEALGTKLGFTQAKGNYVPISMGQGQEKHAENTLDRFASDGGWVFLQNIHLMQNWLPTLERKLEVAAEGHEDFRAFLSAEPPPLPEMQTVPEGIMQASVKVANEPPTDLKATLRSSYALFDQSVLDKSTKPKAHKPMIFALAFFHSLVLGRRKFGFQGFSRNYPFNNGDLTVCASVLHNYLEAAPKGVVPWEDVRYIFGEIMYGGHITDTWDRRLCVTYLEVLLQPDLIDEKTNFELTRGYKPMFEGGYNDYKSYIETALPAESPVLFGLHTNAEIGLLISVCDQLFEAVFTLQGGGGGGGGGDGAPGGQSKEAMVKDLLGDFQSRLPDEFVMLDIKTRIRDKTPYVVCVLQELERMNAITGLMRRELTELELGLSGALNISDAMDTLITNLHTNKVPPAWLKVCGQIGPTGTYNRKPLGLWVADLLVRYRQLKDWAEDPQALPPCVWLSGLFNPMGYITACLQVRRTPTRRHGRRPGTRAGGRNPRPSAFPHGRSRAPPPRPRRR